MKRLMGMLAALLLLTAGAWAENEGVIVQSSCSVVPSGEYNLVYCYAQVHNNSGDIICMDRGSFDLQSGDVLLSTTEVTQLWPYYINPGEDGYLFDIVSFEPDENGNPVMPQITGIDYSIDYLTVDARYASYDLSVETQLEQAASGRMTVRCAVTNNTDLDALNPTVTFGLYTDEGAMLFADGRVLRDVGIPSGGTLLVNFDIDSIFVEQWQSYGAMPGAVRAVATFRGDDD